MTDQELMDRLHQLWGNGDRSQAKADEINALLDEWTRRAMTRLHDRSYPPVGEGK